MQTGLGRIIKDPGFVFFFAQFPVHEKVAGGTGSEHRAEQHKHLIDRVKTALGESVKDVRVSSRLTESPACLVVDDYDMSQNLARVLKQMGQDAPMPTPIRAETTTVGT